MALVECRIYMYIWNKAQSSPAIHWWIMQLWITRNGFATCTRWLYVCGWLIMVFRSSLKMNNRKFNKSLWSHHLISWAYLFNRHQIDAVVGVVTMIMFTQYPLYQCLVLSLSVHCWIACTGSCTPSIITIMHSYVSNYRRRTCYVILPLKWR